MNKRWCFGFCMGLLLNSTLLYSQSYKDSSTIKLKSFLRFQLSWNTGFIWEQKIGKSSVIDLFGGILFAVASDDFSFFDFKSKFIAEPDLYIQYRNYYNFQKRVISNKNIRNNAADYFFIRTETILPVKNQNFFNLLFMQGWGAQRSINKRLNLGVDLGIIEHLYYDKPPTGGFNYTKIEALTDISVSYIF